MNIIFCTWGYPTDTASPINGVGVYTRRLANALRSMGHNITVVTSSATGMQDRYVDANGVTVVVSRVTNIHWYLSKIPIMSSTLVRMVMIAEMQLMWIRKVKLLLDEQCYDVVEMSPIGVGIFWNRIMRMNVPVVSVVHGVHWLFVRERGARVTLLDMLYRHYEFMSAACAALVIAPSEYIARHIRQEYEVEVDVTPMPVVECLQERAGLEDRSSLLRIVTLGGTGVAKGEEDVVCAIMPFVSEHRNVTLSVISGEGNCRMRKAASSLQAEGRIILLPWLTEKDMLQVFLTSHMFITPSLFETYGMTLADAMSARMSVIASDIPAHRELIGHNERGVLYEVNNASMLWAIMTNMLRSPHMREMYGRTAQAWIKMKCSPSMVAERRLGQYRKVLDNMA